MTSVAALTVDNVSHETPEVLASPAQTNYLFGGDITVLPTISEPTKDFQDLLDALEKPQNFIILTTDLQKVASLLSQQGLEMSKEDLKALAEQNKDYHKQSMELLKESLEEMDRARRANRMQKAFGWLAAIFTTAAAAVIALTTGPAGAAVSALMIGLAVDQIVGMSTGKSGLSMMSAAISDRIGGTAGAIVAAVVVTAIILGTTLFAGGAATAMSQGARAGLAARAAKSGTPNGTPGAAGGAGARSNAAGSTPVGASGGTSGASATGEAAEQAVKSSRTWREIWESYAYDDRLLRLQSGTLATSSAGSVGTAAAGTSTAVFQNLSAEAEVEGVRVDKLVQQNKAHVELVIEHIQKLQHHAEQVIQQVASTMQEVASTNRRVIRESV